MSHANARLTVHGRRLAAEGVLAGWRVADVAAQLGCSRTTIHKWVRRWRMEGPAGLADRPSRSHRSPSATPDHPIAQQVHELRRHRHMNREAIARIVAVSPRTAGRLIARAGLGHLADIDPITGQRVRCGPVSCVRYERAHPGELIHLDVKDSGGYPPAADGAFTGEAHAHPGDAGRAWTACTPPSMTTHARSR